MGEKGRQDLGHTIQHRHTCGESMRDNGGQWETRRQQAGRTIQQGKAKRGTMGDKGRIQQRETRKSTMGDKRRQVPRKGGRTIQQGEGRRGQKGTRASERRTHHPTKANKKGDHGRLRGSTGCYRHTCGETMGDKGGQDLGSLTHCPTKAHMWGDNGRQKETRPRGSGQNIQHRLTCEDTMGDKGRQDVGKADGPSNKGKQEGRLETRGDKTTGRRTRHPTQAHSWGDNGIEWGTMGDNGKPGETRP